MKGLSLSRYDESLWNDVKNCATDISRVAKKVK